ncbi:hypothetical protein Ccrd_012230 [Cynara cardunculus var. scolymus]|uniref:O-fucosyltransferase family protein n=1 Tax=Cynara cardunculus var. scolymus TaxID=59895 RepID=A0A103YHW9_CYNCS|nr:hypothetical protein Ccrd_012230 [Cynara cardunculus var. scolymus]
MEQKQQQKMHIMMRKKMMGFKIASNRSRLAFGILLAFFIVMNFWMISRIQDSGPVKGLKLRFMKSNSSKISVPEELRKIGKGKKPQKTAYARLLYKAAHALAEYKSTEPKDLWLEPYHRETMVTLWLLQMAVCNIVAVARLLNATLVIPSFIQFGDIYQEDYFIDYLKPDIRIVKELPKELQSLDLEAIGSVVTDADIGKEAKPSFYLKHILPLLMKNRVVHFVGFGNRLASDPIPYHLQRLRCRCNFHALRFTPKIQATAALLVKRMRQNARHAGSLDEYLVGPFAKRKGKIKKEFRYLGLHLRFEIDMVAHSLCDFGGGEEEKKELEAYREVHFPGLVELKNTTKLTALTSLFPNMVTKENLLSSSEIKPFLNFSSQLAALDFIACTAADVFAMTDSGSQLSSLVSGYRVYYGGGKMPTIRPNKRRLADIFMKNNTIEWKVFETRIRKAVRQNKRIFARPVGRSVYRYPRCSECMCNTQEATLPFRPR